MCRYALFFMRKKRYSFLPFKELSGYKKVLLSGKTFASKIN